MTASLKSKSRLCIRPSIVNRITQLDPACGNRPHTQRKLYMHNSWSDYTISAARKSKTQSSGPTCSRGPSGAYCLLLRSCAPKTPQNIQKCIPDSSEMNISAISESLKKCHFFNPVGHLSLCTHLEVQTLLILIFLCRMCFRWWSNRVFSISFWSFHSLQHMKQKHV